MGLLGAIGVTAGAAFVLGASLGRRPAILVAGLGWPTYALGVWIGLWGHGFSKDDEGWLIATWFVIYTSAAVVGRRDPSVFVSQGWVATA